MKRVETLSKAVKIAKKALEECKKGQQGGIYHSKLEEFARKHNLKTVVVSRIFGYIHSRDIVVHPRKKVVRLYTGYIPKEGRDGFFYKIYEALEIPYSINDLGINKTVKVRENEFIPVR